MGQSRAHVASPRLAAISSCALALTRHCLRSIQPVAVTHLHLLSLFPSRAGSVTVGWLVLAGLRRSGSGCRRSCGACSRRLAPARAACTPHSFPWTLLPGKRRDATDNEVNTLFQVRYRRILCVRLVTILMHSFLWLSPKLIPDFLIFKYSGRLTIYVPLCRCIYI